jgi:hypothetical protein
MTNFKESDHPREEHGRFVPKPRTYRLFWWSFAAGVVVGAALAALGMAVFVGP